LLDPRLLQAWYVGRRPSLVVTVAYWRRGEMVRLRA